MSKSQLQMPSFVGNITTHQNPSICYPSEKIEKNENQQMILCGCRKASKSQWLSSIGVLILLLVYTMMGSILFVSLEGELDEIDGIETAASKPYPRNNDIIYAELRTRTVNQLWSITEDLNVLYKDNWTRLAAHEVKQFQETIIQALQLSRSQPPQTVKQQPSPHKWTYPSAFLYSLTMITTIGYGGITPRSQLGRLAALLYAIFGIPIILLYLSTMGEGLSSAMRCIFKRLRSSSKRDSASSSLTSNGTSSSSATPSSSTTSNNNLNEPSNKNKVEKREYSNWNQTGNSLQHFQNPAYNNNNNYLKGSFTSGNHQKKQKQSAVPISICIMILICYITSGAALFHELQKWGVLESLYFCFTVLSTIGFGDLQPKDEIGMYAASAYIVIGMAIVAMCFSLIQTELIIWLRKFAIHEQSHGDDEIALVNVSITPIKS